MTRLYEAMFLLDNQVVREDWKKAKAIVTDTLTKHGATVKCARRWDERKLAYPIRGKHRATYLIAYYEMGNEAIPAMRRDFELNESVLRYLILARELIPDGEIDLAAAEQAADFSVPAPPCGRMRSAPSGRSKSSYTTNRSWGSTASARTSADTTSPERFMKASGFSRNASSALARAKLNAVVPTWSSSFLAG